MGKNWWIVIMIYFGRNGYAFEMNSSDNRGETVILNFIQRHMNDLPLTIISSDRYQILDSIRLSEIQSRIIVTRVIDIPRILVNDNNNYIIIGKSLDELDSILSGFAQTEKWSSNSKFMVLFHIDGDLNFISNVFKKLWNLNIYNSVVSVDSENFYTWFPYAIENKCGVEFHLSKYNLSDSFANKIPDRVFGCEFNMTMIFLKSYKNQKATDGLIPAYVDLICEKLNLTLSFMPKYFRRAGGNLYLIPKIMENENIQAGHVIVFLVNRIPCNFCEYSRSLHDDMILQVVPSRKKLATNILGIFPKKVAICYTCMVTFFVITWKYINQIAWKQSMFDVMQLLLAFRTRSSFTSQSAYLMVILLLWYSFIMDTVYSTGLSSILTSPELSPKINSLDELLQSEYQISGDSLIYRLETGNYTNEAVEMKEKIMHGSLNRTFRDNARFFMKHPNHSTGLSSDMIYWQVKNPKDMEVIWDHPVGKLSHHLILKRNHPLFRRINYWILAIQETGLPKKWLFDFMVELEKYEIKVQYKGNRKLDMLDMQNSFRFLMMGQVLSVCTFLAELAYQRYTLKTYREPGKLLH